MRTYARHKRFVFDIQRMINEDVVLNVSTTYLSLCGSTTLRSEISKINNKKDDKIFLLLLKKIEKNDDMSDIYEKLSCDKLLSPGEITFRLRRIKYLKASHDSINFIITPLLED